MYKLDQPSLLFESSRVGRRTAILPGSDVPERAISSLIPEAHLSAAAPPLPELSELDVVRHYTNLSTLNMSIDSNFYPLGSCTMKYNPKRNERLAALPGFAAQHPYQDPRTLQGLLAILFALQEILAEVAGLHAVSLQPAAGAQGELTALFVAAAYFRDQGTRRTQVLIPDSAHGTNPASAHLAGFEAVTIKSDSRGLVDLADFEAKLSDETAVFMMTNPNTLGLFDPQIGEIAKLLHDRGALLYLDGANMNAILGVVRPGDMGVDLMHYNAHKTFSGPHGGGGPGAGPVVLSERLAPFAPVPFVVERDGSLELVEHAEGTSSFGRMSAFHGQMGMFVRALAFILSHGADGLRQASEDAVLAANYVRATLSDLMSAPFGDRPCMHEALFDDRWLKETGLTTLDFAKAMIDEGYHPMTVYFPLVVHGAMLIEPTESESKASLDLFLMTLRDLALSALRGEKERFVTAPHLAPRRRLDETRAARQPVLRWTKPTPL
jgi:glycine dehydrogenase subunit 2